MEMHVARGERGGDKARAALAPFGRYEGSADVQEQVMHEVANAALLLTWLERSTQALAAAAKGAVVAT